MQGSAWARNAGRMWLLGKARRSGKASFAPRFGSGGERRRGEPSLQQRKVGPHHLAGDLIVLGDAAQNRGQKGPLLRLPSGA
jgi:hypothetical protein